MKRIIATLAGTLLATAACGPGRAEEATPDHAAAVVAAPATPAAAEPSPPPSEAAHPAAEGAEPASPSAPVEAETGEHASTAGPEPTEHGEHGEHAEATAPVRSPMPYDIIRTLQFLQDQVARGNGRAIRVQAMVLRRFAPNFMAAGPDVWSDARNRRAAILFTLSGGPPDVLRNLMAQKVFDDSMLPMAEGALAYVQNDLKRAASVLSKIELSDVEPGLAAHLHLVLGQLLQTELPAVAAAHLDQARLRAPGGLIEEAALRLEVVLVDKLGDHDRSDNLARQYFDRFPKSSYADNFLARFAMVYDDRGGVDPQAALAKIFDIGKRLDDSDRRALLLALSRRALVAGHLEFAQLAGGEALKIQGIPDEDKQRANLYTAAASLASMDPLKAASELQSVDRQRLHPADAGLLDAANSVLSHMESPLIDTASAEASPASSATLDRAQRLLDAVAGDLGDKTR